MKPAAKRILAAGITAAILAAIPAFVGIAGKNYHAELKNSDELRIGLMTAPLTMDPQMATDLVSVDYMSLCQAQLYVMREGSQPEPELAESCEISDDGCTYTFHLRDGICYQDGTPITAEDFVFCWRRIADPDTGTQAFYNLTDCMSLKNAVAVVSGELPPEQLGVSAPDSKTFVVELEQPCPYLLALISSAVFSPANESFVRRMGDSYATSPETMLCSGAFVPDRYIPLDPEMHFTRNPNYVFADRVSLSGVTVRQVANAQQAMMCYQSDGFDIIDVSGETVELAQGDPSLLTVGSGNSYFFILNVNHNPFLANHNIRHALCMSLDRSRIVQYVLKQGYHPVYSVTPPEFAADPDGTDFCKAQDRYSEYSAFNPEKAREYWEKGLQELGVSSITLNLLCKDVRIIEPVVNSMQETLPGLTLEVRNMTAQQLADMRGKSDFDILFSGWMADYPDPKSMLESMMYQSVLNADSWQNDQYDRILRTNCMETDPVKRCEMLHAAEDLLMEDCVMIPYYYQSVNWLISDRIQDYSFNFRGSFPFCSYIRKERT